MAARNGFWGSPNRSRAIELKTQGWSNPDIAEFISELESLTGDQAYTDNQVESYLTSQLSTSSTHKLLHMNRGKDLIRFKAEADEFFETFRRELNASVATGDAKRMDIAAKHLKAWFDSRLLVNGVGGGPSSITQNNFYGVKSPEDIERDALLQAVKEWLQATPEAWDAVSTRAREIAQGALSVPGAIDVQPSKPEAL